MKILASLFLVLLTNDAFASTFNVGDRVYAPAPAIHSEGVVIAVEGDNVIVDFPHLQSVGRQSVWSELVALVESDTCITRIDGVVFCVGDSVGLNYGDGTAQFVIEAIFPQLGEQAKSRFRRIDSYALGRVFKVATKS